MGVFGYLIRWVLEKQGKKASEEELKRLEEEAKRGRLGMVFWNKESAKEWNREMLKMLGEKSKYLEVLAGDMDRTYYMLPHIPHAWKILERVGAMKEVMGGLIINDEVMDHFIDLEPAHISWAWMMGARTPEELKVLGKAILFAELISERDSKYKDQHYPRADPKYVKELADLIEQLKDEHEFVKEGYELLQKFRQEGRPFGKTVFDEQIRLLLLRDKVMVVEGDVDIQGTSVIVRDGNAEFKDFSSLAGMRIEIESVEPIFEGGEFRGIKLSGTRLAN